MATTWALMALLTLCGGAQPPAPASAARFQSTMIGQPVSEIHIVLDGRPLEDPSLGRVIETRAGSPLSTVAVRESIVHLMALGRFADVRVRAVAGPTGVTMIYELVSRRQVERIVFRGQLGVSERDLHALVRDRFTNQPPLSRIEEVARAVEGFCADHGYLSAKATASTEDLADPTLARLVLDVAAGQQARFGDVVIEGVSSDEAATVRARLGLDTGLPFVPAALGARIARYVSELRAADYLDAKVEPAWVPSADRLRVGGLLKVSRGPRVIIEFRGDPLPEDRRSDIEMLRREGAVDQDILENEQRGIENALRARGYSRAAAPFTRDVRSEHEHRIVFTITRGPQFKIGRIEVVGHQDPSAPDILSARRVSAGQWFVRAHVDADAATIEELYRRRGYLQAEVRWSEAVRAGGQPVVDLQIVVVEGPRVTVGDIVFDGNREVGTNILNGLVSSPRGGPYYQPFIDADREAIRIEYLRRGYQLATVHATATAAADPSRVDVRFIVSEGPQFLVDQVLVAGHVRTKAAVIEREVGIERGMPLSPMLLGEAQRRLIALGLFRRVQVSELQRGSEVRRDVLVQVEEAPVHTIGYGGGLEGAQRLRTDTSTGVPVERFDLAPRGFFEIGRRNLWGKNRSVNLFARGAIRTSDQFTSGSTDGSTTAVDALDDTSSGFREYRVLVTYREPRFLNTPVDVVVTAALDQAIRSTFDFNRRQVYLEGGHRFGGAVSVAGRYAFSHTRLFNERILPEKQLDVDKLFPRVRLSSFSASVVRNTRDDPFDPTRGTLVMLDGLLAARAIGSEVGFTRVLVQGFAFRQAPYLRGAVLAVGARLGLATGFPQQVLDPSGSGQIVTLEQEIPASERFFTGGDTTVRGFTLDRLGAVETLDQNGVSVGGNGLLIFNAELRFPAWRSKGLGAAVFIDTGNVFAKFGDIRLDALRSGAGFGIRWKSPVGPLRIDLAWKLAPMEFINGTRENRFAWYVTIGQPF